MLDFQTIKNITVGAAEIWQEKDGVHFTKCTHQQIKEWKKIDPPCIYENNVFATTGVRLDFHTDSPYVEVEVAQGNKYEVKINDVLTHQFVNPGRGAFSFRFDLKNNGESSHVVLVLPCHDNGGVITSISIKEGASIIPHTFDKKILFLGDSITQGWEAHFNSLSFAYLISDHFNAESIIQGIGTSRFEPTTVLDIGFKPEIVFVAYGTNDFGHLSSLEELKDNAHNYLLKVKQVYPHSKIYVISPIWRTDEDVVYRMGSFYDCNNTIKSVAKALSLPIIDGEKLVPPHKKFMADCLHPNDLGFSIYALNLLRIISKDIK